MPKIAKSSIENIEAAQWERLKDQLVFVSNNSKFYQAHFKENNVVISDINSIEDLAKIPTVNKHDVQRKFKDFWCTSNENIVDYTNTSGTEGQPVTIPLTESDLERLAYNEMLSLSVANGSKNDIYQLTTTVDRRFMAGLAYVLGVRKLGAGMIRIGPGLPKLQWKTIEEINPSALIIVPSFLVKLIDYAKRNGIDYKKSSISKAVCIGEPIRNRDFSFNALGKRIKKDWDIELYSTYASSEMATAFTECEAGRGGHLLPELIVGEILDEEGHEVADGVAGELTITTLGVTGFPLVRFRTGDICVMHHEPCSCGRNTPRLGPVLGRKHQMIKLKGTTCYPPAIFDVLDNIAEISHYQAEISIDELGNDDLLIRYAITDSIEIDTLINSFKTGLRFTPRLECMNEEEILPLIYQPQSRKPVKLVDKRNL